MKRLEMVSGLSYKSEWKNKPGEYHIARADGFGVTLTAYKDGNVTKVAAHHMSNIRLLGPLTASKLKEITASHGSNA